MEPESESALLRLKCAHCHDVTTQQPHYDWKIAAWWIGAIMMCAGAWGYLLAWMFR
jgi:hypothetical protein